MEHETLVGRIFRGVALTLILVFFMFPIVWILLMSFQTNEHILRIPPISSLSRHLPITRR